MRYHNITKDDMKNGEGLRVVLWLAGCAHKCLHCHNPITWDENGGLVFDGAAKQELMGQLEKDYIHGITFSGGDPLFPANRQAVGMLAKEIKERFAQKTVWLYTGYLWEDIANLALLESIDVLVDGPYQEALKDAKYEWAGSSNQRVIDVAKSKQKGTVVVWKSI